MIFEVNNKTYLEEVLELVNESVAVLSKNMEVVRFNTASKALFGAEELAGYPLLTAFIHPEDVELFEDAFRRASIDCSSTPLTVEYRTRSIVVTPIVMSAPHTETAQPTPQLIPLEHRYHDNSYGWVKSTLCKIGHRSQNDDVHVVTRSIMYERREVNDRYNKLKASEELERINAAKLRYISCVAHELNTPVSSFCFMLDLLQHTVLSAEQQELLQQGAVATDMMKLTICQTMDISKALTGAKLRPLLATVDLSKLLKRVNLIINGFGKQVPVTYEVAADVRNSVLTDEEWLRQMLLSLLTNACKCTDRGSIRVVVSLSSGDPVAAPMLLFEVIDTGIGVSDANLTIMFEAYAQLQESQMTGTGLGLFGLRTRAEGLQGTCGAQHNLASCTGTGTVVWFSVPYVPDSSIECSIFCDPPQPLDSQTQLLPLIPGLQEAEGESEKQIADVLNCSRKHNAEQLISKHKLIAEELISTRKVAAEELISNNKLIAEEMISINKLIAEELVRSDMLVAEELISSEELTAKEQISISKLTAEELITSNKLTADWLSCRYKLTAEELIISDQLTAEEEISINKLTAKELISSNKLTAEELMSSGRLTAEKQININKLTAEELISSDELIAKGLSSSNKLTAEELISSDKRSAEELISSGKLTVDEETSINKLIAKELIDSNKLIAEGLNNSEKLAADWLSLSYKRSAEELINSGKVTAEELINSNERTAEELIISGKLTAEELISSDKLIAEELICYQKLTAKNLSYGRKLAAEELIISDMLTAEQLVSNGKLTAEELNRRRKRIAEDLRSYQKLTAEALINSEKLTAEKLVDSDKLTAENLVNRDKLTAEKLINSDKLTAEVLINSDRLTAGEISIRIKLSGSELIRSRKLTAMVVEDTFTVRKLMQKLLLNMGFERVDCYEDGSKGLDAMMAAPVDIVFSDIQMPIMGGSEMVRRLRQSEAGDVTSGGARQLVIAVTANASENEMCGPDGFDQICSKPLSMKEIYKIVDTYC